MKKSGKFILGLAAVGAVVGAIFAYLNKSKYLEDLEEDDYDFDSGNFHLDPDLQSTDHREYVPLTPKKESELEEAVADTVRDAAEKADAAAETVAGKINDIAETAAEKIDDAADIAEDIGDAAADGIEDLADIVKDSVD